MRACRRTRCSSREVEEDLQHGEPLVAQQPFELADVAVPPVTLVGVDHADHTGGDDVLVVRAVPGAEDPPRRVGGVDPPEVVVREIGPGRGP